MDEKVAASVIGGATGYALTHVDRELGYQIDFPYIIKILKFKCEQLDAARLDIQERIEVSLKNNEVTRKVVTDWLEKVKYLLKRAGKLNEKATKIDASIEGFLRVSPSRNSVARKASKKTKQIQELLDKRSQLVKVGDSKHFQDLELVSFGDFEAFASRKDTTKKIFKALRVKRIVGVFGMPGVGKTELMRALAKQAKEEELFNEVVIVIVSQNPDIGRIQKDIAKQLGLQLDGSSVAVAAVELSDCLKNRDKKVFVAFDDIWEGLDLNKVGIPYRRNTQSNCKVLFTTRSESVCDQMEADVKLQVGVLSEADSWRLFRLKAGDVADSSSHREVAQEVLNKCKGLPLAIVTLGLSLRNRNKKVWLDARTRLKRSVYEGMDPVITIVKFSYDFFRDDKAAQMCFLFCSLFPEDFPIKTDVLLSYILGEELLGKEVNMEEARNRLHAIIDRLISSGMLLSFKKDGYEGDIMMHDVIRHVAVRIASDPKEGEGFIVRSGLGLKDWPAIDREMDKCRRLSLMCNHFRFLPPHQITASLLLTLSLFGNNIVEIPSDFFKEMKNLKTLDLSSNLISSLPESFECLKSLHTLLMEHCDRLTDISLVGELEMLEILSIRYSLYVQIPESMQKLTNLKILNAYRVQRKFPPRVISSLHRLEELYLGHWNVQTELVFSEVASLTRLTCLEISLPFACMWIDFPGHKNLCRFSIYVITGDDDVPEDEFELGTRRLSLHFENWRRDFFRFRSIRMSNWVGVLLEKIEGLRVHQLHHFLSLEGMNANSLYQDLLYLHVMNCKQLRHLLSTRKPLFSNLKELDLCILDDFVSICDGPLPEGCLSELRVLHVDRCPKMRTFIPVDLLGNLQNLEHLHLDDCEGLEKVVEFEGFMSQQPPSSIFPYLRKMKICDCDKLKCVLPLKADKDLMLLEELYLANCSGMEMVFEGDRDDADKDKAIIHSLKKLTLVNLPSLTSFGPQGLLYDFPALVKMGVINCGRMERLPLLDKDSIPKLEKLYVQSGWFDRLDWKDESLKVHLKSLPGFVEDNLSADGIDLKSLFGAEIF